MRELSRAVGVAVLVAACSSASVPPPTPATSDRLVGRHPDQVCRVQTEERPVVRISEIFDTVGVSVDLGAIGVAPLPVALGSTTVQWHTVDFISRYGADGQPRLTGVWETSLDPGTTARVEEVLAGRVRAVAGLLEPEGFRSVAILSSSPTLEIAPPVVCTPHMRHVLGERPRGLPIGVRLRTVSSSYRQRRGQPVDMRMAVVLVEFDRSGTVTTVEALAGDSTSVGAARGIIGQLEFDPALRNGEAVLGQEAYMFRFPEGFLPRGGRTRVP